MNTQGLKKIIGTKFSGNIEDVSENIFRVDAEFNNKPFARYYFDCSDSFLSKNFDLLAYQQRLLSADYYKSTGSLQWNFYLYFITNIEFLTSEIRQKIESDKNFSRKLITDEVGLIKLFEVQEKLKIDSSKNFDNSLLSVWKDKLTTINLQGIYLVDTYPKLTDVYTVFFEGKKFAEAPQTKGKVTPTSTQTGLITSLSLKGYRAFKEKKQFEFKKVNLITGVNGTGKTSLLEALELCICGQTFENPKKTEPHQELSVTYHDGGVDKYSPEETKKYQERDRVWFGNNVLRGNSLSQSFHVYNFFDSDSAARFASETKGEAIQQIFSRIVLGEQTNVVFDRINRINDKINDEARRLSKELGDVNREMTSNRQKINELNANSVIITVLGQIIEQLSQIGWKGSRVLLADENNDQSKFRSELAIVVAFFSSIEQIFWVENPNIKSLSNELRKLEELLQLNRDFANTSNKLLREIKDHGDRLRTIDRQLAALDEAIPYFSEPEILQINSLQKNLELLTSKENTIQRILSSLTQFTDSRDKSIEEILDSCKEQLNQLMSDQKKITESLKETERRLGRIRTISVELKTLGKEFISLTANDQDCPLCKTHFSDRRVSEIIEELKDAQDDAAQAAELVAQLAHITTDINMLQKRIADINDITTLMHRNDLEKKEFNPEKIYETSNRLDEVSNEVSQELLRLTTLNSSFNEKSLSSDGLRKQTAQLSDAGITFQIGKDSHQQVEEQRHVISESRLPVLQKEMELRSLFDSQRRELSQAFAIYFKYDDPDGTKYQSYIEQVNVRTKSIKSVIERLPDIAKLLDFEESEQLLPKAEKIKDIQTLFDDYLRVTTDNRLRTEYLDREKGLNGQINELSKNIELLKSAQSVLQEIITVNNRENFLKSFFNSNKENILNIFRAIHLPNEFDDISFESTESIKLKVTGTNELRDLTEISTGQKSAFILSLFLTLNNNIKTGPPMMIFDDPVAYVDDINTLSFLDFLRDQVIYSDKQIFFATANGKLANLFRQKFGFLESDFQVVNLEKVTETGTENV